MQDVWPWFLALPSLVQAGILAVALVAVGMFLQRLGWIGRSRRSTVYIEPTRGGTEPGGTRGAMPPERNRPPVAPNDRPRASREEVEFDDGRGDEEGEEFDREMATLELPPMRPRLQLAEWARDRPLCPCCGYPGGYSADWPTTCVMCDWEDPPAETIGWGVARSDWRKALAAARDSYDATGSALSPEDRADWAGELSPEQIALREEARSLFDYLRSGDRPDASEVLDRTDAIFAQLRAIADEPRWVDD